MRLTNLAKILRGGGLTVHEEDGWKTRGSSDYGPVLGMTIHETRGSINSTTRGEIDVLLKGSKTAPPPIAPLLLARNGDWHVVASGKCNHNLVGWAGPNKDLGNRNTIGIEAVHALGEPWTAVQYESYVRGAAVLAKELGIPVAKIAGHKEHQPAGYGQPSVKTDPSFNMNSFRSAILRAQEGEEEMGFTIRDLMEYKIASTSLGGEYTVQDLLKQGLTAARLLQGGQVMVGPDKKPVPNIGLVEEFRNSSEFLNKEIARLPEDIVEAFGGSDLSDAELADIIRRGLGDRLPGVLDALQ